jgi:predicted HAD superfamily phosphohydrolase
LFNLYDQSAADLDKVIEESQAMRAKLRGEAVAGLG